jgi:ADP-ribose pyrophosphatase YjhB (NUDIX family)
MRTVKETKKKSETPTWAMLRGIEEETGQVILPEDIQQISDSAECDTHISTVYADTISETTTMRYLWNIKASMKTIPLEIRDTNLISTLRWFHCDTIQNHLFDWIMRPQEPLRAR